MTSGHYECYASLYQEASCCKDNLFSYIGINRNSTTVYIRCNLYGIYAIDLSGTECMGSIKVIMLADDALAPNVWGGCRLLAPIHFNTDLGYWVHNLSYYTYEVTSFHIKSDPHCFGTLGQYYACCCPGYLHHVVIGPCYGHWLINGFDALSNARKMQIYNRVPL